MSEVGRLVNVIVDPKPAFADIAARPSFWVPMVLVTLCVLGYLLAFSSHVGWEHFLRQQFENSSRAQNMSPEDKEKNIEMTLKVGPIIGTAMPVIITPVLMLITAGVLLFVFNNMFGATAQYKQALAVAAYASLPRVLATAGALAVMFLKDPTDFDLKNPAGYNLGFYVDPHSVPAWLHSLFTSIDVFTIWVVLLLAAGMAAVTRKPFKSALTGVLIPWAVVVLIGMAWAAIFGY
jgi:hypothetical protein